MDYNKYDVIVIGMGPSSIFLAYELIKLKKLKKVLLIEQGKRVENRNCPLEEIGKCIKCKPFCNITSGFSGAGAFSDGKFIISTEYGGHLQDLIGDELAQQYMCELDNILIKFGANSENRIRIIWVEARGTTIIPYPHWQW